MGFLKLLDEFNTEHLDNKQKDTFLSRKDALGKLSNFSKKLALSAVPLGAISAFSTPAMAQSTDIEGVLNFALTLEYLEDSYYKMGLDSGIITDSDAKTVYKQISKHESAHVSFLQDTITSLDGTPIARTDLTFDFTVSGAFDPFDEDTNVDSQTSYAQFLALSQAFEDTGVRAYKGQAANAMGNDTVLTAALRIHSVEARHAAEVRRLRGLNGWITQAQRGKGMPEATQPVYNGEDNNGEDNTKQVVEVSDILSGDGDVSADNITEAWDEPLTEADVRTITNLFIQ